MFTTQAVFKDVKGLDISQWIVSSNGRSPCDEVGNRSGEPWPDPARPSRMAGFVGELLIAVARAFITDWAYSAFLKAEYWLDGMIGSRKKKVVVRMLLGLAAFILIPIFISGFLGLAGL